MSDKIKEQKEDINNIISEDDIKNENINSNDLCGAPIFQLKNIYYNCTECP